MLKKVKIDKSIYLVDEEDKSYTYFSHNPSWRKLSVLQNAMHKKSLDGYTRIFRNDTTKKFHFYGNNFRKVIL